MSAVQSRQGCSFAPSRRPRATPSRGASRPVSSAPRCRARKNARSLPDKDYSGTPLGKKLGAKPGVDVLVLFSTSQTELERRFGALKATMAPADGLWVAWPKKAAKLETDLDFDT